MKTVKKGDEIVRVSNEDAILKVKDAGYSYCKKSDWKKGVRDKGKATAAPVAKAEVEKIVKEVKEKHHKKPRGEGESKYLAKKAQKKSE